MMQHSMKKGIKLFGSAGIDAVLKELKQLHDRKVLAPKGGTKMSKETALQYVMLLKKETRRHHQRKRTCQATETKSMHCERGRGPTNSSN
jgi:hypothetical protein